MMVYNSYKDGMDVTVRHLVPEKLPAFVLRKASDAQQAAKAVTEAAEVGLHLSAKQHTAVKGVQGPGLALSTCHA